MSKDVGSWELRSSTDLDQVKRQAAANPIDFEQQVDFDSGSIQYSTTLRWFEMKGEGHRVCIFGTIYNYYCTKGSITDEYNIYN